MQNSAESMLCSCAPQDQTIPLLTHRRWWGVSNFLALVPHFNCKITPPAIKSTQPLFRTGTFNLYRISHSHTQSQRQPVWKIYINPLCSNTKLYKSWDMQNAKQVRSTLLVLGDTINTGNSKLSHRSLALSKKMAVFVSFFNCGTICNTKRDPGPAPSPSVWSWFHWGQISSTACWQ